MLEIMQKAKDLKDAMEDVVIEKPTALTDLQKWTKLWLKFSTYLGHVRGAVKIPLTYLIHDQGDVTNEVAAAEYDTKDERLIATMVLEGSHYDLDNTMLYNEFKPLVVDGPSWGFIKKYDKTKNGRGAVLALKAQAEGQSAKLTRNDKSTLVALRIL